MNAEPLSWVVALDGGTTNTRARLLHDGRVVATARQAVGVRDAVLGGGTSPLARAVRDTLQEVLQANGGVRPDAVVAAGMLTADVGLLNVPHVVAPAGLDELARASVTRTMPDIFDGPILFVPGVRTPAGPAGEPSAWAEADVMRGEECETLGAAEALGLAGPAAYLWPGSHTKLVVVDGQGRIVRSVTTLAGEMTSAMARHTLLAASLPADLPDDPDPAAFEEGARLSVRDGIGRAAFLVRVAALTGGMDPARRSAFWLGAVVGDDAYHLGLHPALDPSLSLRVGGRRSLRVLYTTLLRRTHRGPVESLDDETAEAASALGALAVARRHRAEYGW